MTLKIAGDLDVAYGALYKAIWSYAWQAPPTMPWPRSIARDAICAGAGPRRPLAADQHDEHEGAQPEDGYAAAPGPP